MATARLGRGRAPRLGALAAGLVLSGLAVAGPRAPAGASALRSPVSISFVTPNTGWELDSSYCLAARPGIPCLSLWRTSDAGRHWRSLRVPALVTFPTYQLSAANAPFTGLSISFANARDGWIYGWYAVNTSTSAVPALWSTHNGGASWSRPNLARLGVKYAVLDVAAAQGVVHLMAWHTGSSVSIWSSTVGADRWRLTSTAPLSTPAGGSTLTGAFTLRAHVGWAVIGNDRGVSGAARLTSTGRWVPWSAPCASVGDSYVVPVALSASELAVVCTIGGYGAFSNGPTPPGALNGAQWLYLSGNGGTSFRAISALRLGLYVGPVSFPPGFPLMPNDHTLLVPSAQLQATSGVGVLLMSSDAGQSWSVVFRGDAFTSFSALEPVTPRVAYAIVSDGSITYLIATSSAGASWRRVPGPA